MDVLRRLGPERADQLALYQRVGTMVGAADHVRDPEVDLVHRGRELVGRRPVRAEQRHAPVSHRALGVLASDRPGGLAMAVGALALADWTLVPHDAEPLQVPEDPAGVLVARRVGVVDPQQQRPAPLVREAAVRDGRQRVAEMERARRARREADARCHRARCYASGRKREEVHTWTPRSTSSH